MSYFDTLFAKSLAGGGGGSSDFSTTEVTIANNTADMISLQVPYITTDREGNKFLSCYIGVFEEESVTIEAVLYKGAVDAYVNGDHSSVSVTGNIAYSDPTITITGEGTITVS